MNNYIEKIKRTIKAGAGLIVFVLIFVLFSTNINEYYRIGQLLLMLGLGGFIYNLVDEYYFTKFDTLEELKNGNVAVGLFTLGFFVYLSVCILSISI